jgi:uncharacterized membrane protein YeaQ/YmgE (transglycosylase-associated protein family)
MSSESLLVILFVGLVAGWLAVKSCGDRFWDHW